MKAPRPSYEPALKALQAFRASPGRPLSAEDQETLREIARRLRRLHDQAGRLTNLNNSLLEKQALHLEFEPETDTVRVRCGELEQTIKLRRADSAVAITMRELTSGGAYEADSSLDDAATNDESEQLVFESLLEDYYQSAHRVLKLVKTLPGLNAFECREITTVRNWLVEHPPKGEVYSFGFGSSGPVVRPMHKPERKWKDQGLVPNTEAFVRRLTRAFGS